jgi:hypothetical protein
MRRLIALQNGRAMIARISRAAAALVAMRQRQAEPTGLNVAMNR